MIEIFWGEGGGGDLAEVYKEGIPLESLYIKFFYSPREKGT